MSNALFELKTSLGRRIGVGAETAAEECQAQTPRLLDREKARPIRSSIDGQSDQQ
jgi:hypothetical protein